LAPTKQVVGIEDPWLLTAEVPNYLDDAWNARGFLNELQRRPLSNVDVALAVNSRLSRAQDQLHIHIGCISGLARRAIGSVAPELSDSGWKLVNLGTRGPKIWARRIGQKTLEGANAFRLAAEGLPNGIANLAQAGIVVAGSELADGREGFVALAWFDDAAMPSRKLAAESFLDPHCSQ
jgi:CDP-diacylglycerol pyrophosphatase